MTPELFVRELKADVRNQVGSTIKYLVEPPPRSRPPEHLATLSVWFNGLSEKDREIATMAMEYTADGVLFGLLSLLDNVASLPSSIKGEFELNYVSPESTVRLNNPDGDFLYDIFNNTA